MVVRRAEAEGYKVLIAIELNKPKKEGACSKSMSRLTLIPIKTGSIYLSFATSFFNGRTLNRLWNWLNKIEIKEPQ